MGKTYKLHIEKPMMQDLNPWPFLFQGTSADNCSITQVQDLMTVVLMFLFAEIVKNQWRGVEMSLGKTTRTKSDLNIF